MTIPAERRRPTRRVDRRPRPRAASETGAPFATWLARLVACAIVAVLLLFATTGRAETWQEALAHMPLDASVRELTRSNCVEVMLHAFQSNATVKALIFMPGATDELYFFHRVRATVANPSPSLLDAVAALTNQTFIRAEWRPPLLLLHTQEDSIEPIYKIAHESTAAKIRARSFLPHALFNDRDWDFLLPILKQHLRVGFRPWSRSFSANHFYRHSFAAWNLTGWEALEAVALAGKTTFTVGRGRVVFAGDDRVLAPPPEVPTLESFRRLIQPPGTTNAPVR